MYISRRSSYEEKAHYFYSRLSFLAYLGWLMGSHLPTLKPSIYAGSESLVTQPRVTSSVTHWHQKVSTHLDLKA